MKSGVSCIIQSGQPCRLNLELPCLTSCYVVLRCLYSIDSLYYYVTRVVIIITINSCKFIAGTMQILCNIIIIIIIRDTTVYRDPAPTNRLMACTLYVIYINNCYRAYTAK